MIGGERERERERLVLGGGGEGGVRVWRAKCGVPWGMTTSRGGKKAGNGDMGMVAIMLMLPGAFALAILLRVPNASA
jgi:hypothetical protein